MHGWLYRDLSISACVLLPVGFGVLLARLGVEKRAARSLFAFSFYGCQTAVTACAIWVARIHAEARVLPALALAGWLVTASLAWLVSRFLRSTPKKRGAFILSMAMSNNGFTLLGFVALAAYGEVGLAQATYAQLLYAPFFLLCCFPIARSFGSQAAPQPLARTLLANAIDPRVWLPLTAIAIGLTLNAGHVARPAFVAQLTRGLILIGTAASSCAIGLLFSGFHLKRYWRENLISLGYRCTLYPLSYWLAARLVGLTALDTRILVLYGLVPSALLANMLAVFFDLDSELTSSVFMVSTVSFLLFVLPVYLFWAQPSF
ncbi:MAG TPA: AEC family transporter [Polyangiaceae bacterium]|nr:AEC family transporter [Polyangiaceae bacterium]